MFDILTAISSSLAISAVYKTLHQLFERRKPETHLSRKRKEELHKRLMQARSELSEEEQNTLANLLSLEILEEIELKEEKSVSDFSEEEVKKYTLPLASLVHQRIRNELPSNAKSAQTALDILRSSSP